MKPFACCSRNCTAQDNAHNSSCGKPARGGTRTTLNLTPESKLRKISPLCMHRGRGVSDSLEKALRHLKQGRKWGLLEESGAINWHENVF